MVTLFIISSAIAMVATLLAVTARVTLHALLYLAVSLIAVALVFYSLGAPFVAALEVIIYAGAIVVLFVFAVMLLSADESRAGVGGRQGGWRWLGPGILAAVLLAEIVYVIVGAPGQAGAHVVGSAQVGVTLFGPYALGIELSSMLLLVALIGVTHIAGHRRRRPAGDPGAGSGPMEVVGPEPREAVGVAGPAPPPAPGSGGEQAP